MRKLLYLFLILTSTSIYSQEVEFGTIFTIEFNDLKNSMDFSLISKKSFNGIIDVSEMDSIIKTVPKENQIIGVFANGKFGNRNNSMLVLISGLNDYIDYDLKTKTPNKRRFQKTSTASLFKGVKSIEYWPYPIEKIDFKEFRVLPKEDFQPFQIEVKVDSTCIKNSDKNIEFGEQEFKSHLKSVISELTSNDKFELEKVLEYEKSINSEGVSLGHFWSLGEGIYPNTNEFKFGDPISYRRFECPYFEGKMNYFYTKIEREIKVVSFNWQTFKESNFGTNPEIEKNLSEKFSEKYDFIVETVSVLLGKPLNLEQEKDSGRIDTKWKSTTGINAYLFKFKTFNEVRLYIYKE